MASLALFLATFLGADAGWARLYVLDEPAPTALVCRPSFVIPRDRSGQRVRGGFMIVAHIGQVSPATLVNLSITHADSLQEWMQALGHNPGCVSIWVAEPPVGILTITLSLDGERRVQTRIEASHD